ncbi:MAG: hypothetical protein KBS82_03125 [Oscillospiraceae bacterium]|nr:hypothetical protein [Candidatus Limimonas egerieequi]
MAKKKTEIINEEIVETPAVEEAPKKKRGRPRKNPELSNEIKETADKVVEEIKETADDVKETAQEAAEETKSKAQVADQKLPVDGFDRRDKSEASVEADQPLKTKADVFQEKWNSAKDLTEEFEKEDIEKNSAYAVLGYFGILVLIPIIFAPNSKYARFHANQAVILFIMNTVYLLVAAGVIALLALAGKVAAIIAGLIFALLSLVIFVMWAKGLSNAASGRAKKLPLIGEYEIIDVD